MINKQPCDHSPDYFTPPHIKQKMKPQETIAKIRPIEDQQESMANNKKKDIQCECKETFDDGTCKDCDGTGLVKEKKSGETKDPPATKTLAVTSVDLEKDSDSGSGAELTDTDDELVEEDSESKWRPKRKQQGRVTSAGDDRPSPSSPTT